MQEDVIRATQLFDRLICGETLTADERDAVTPAREHSAALYRYLKAEGGFEGSPERLYHIFRETIPCDKLRPTIEVLRQAGLITVQNGGDLLTITVPEASGKADLNATPLMMRLLG